MKKKYNLKKKIVFDYLLYYPIGINYMLTLASQCGKSQAKVFFYIIVKNSCCFFLKVQQQGH